MGSKDALFKLGFRNFVHKNPVKRDGKIRLLLYGIYVNRSLTILLVEDGEDYKIEQISLDHNSEKELLNKLFGENPTTEDIINILQSLNDDNE